MELFVCENGHWIWWHSRFINPDQGSLQIKPVYVIWLISVKQRESILYLMVASRKKFPLYKILTLIVAKRTFSFSMKIWRLSGVTLTSTDSTVHKSHHFTSHVDITVPISHSRAKAIYIPFTCLYIFNIDPKTPASSSILSTCIKKCMPKLNASKMHQIITLYSLNCSTYTCIWYCIHTKELHFSFAYHIRLLSMTVYWNLICYFLFYCFHAFKDQYMYHNGN